MIGKKKVFLFLLMVFWLIVITGCTVNREPEAGAAVENGKTLNTAQPPSPADQGTPDGNNSDPLTDILSQLPTAILPTPTLDINQPTPTPETLPLPDQDVGDSNIAGPLEVAPFKVEIETGNNMTLAGTYYPPQQAESPAILFLHMIGGDRQVWNDLALAAQQAGYAGLAIDLQGHGESEGESGEVLTVNRDGLNSDLTAVLDWLAGQEDIDPQRIVVIGAGFSGDLALQEAENYGLRADQEPVQAVGLLSPVAGDLTQLFAKVLGVLGTRPIFIAAAEDDPFSVGMADLPGSTPSGDVQVQFYPGKAHGTNLLLTEPALKQDLLAWLERVK